jgi:hypothetical protein
MLGEINLVQWRCLAELIDNSIDGFLNAQKAGTPISDPAVYISLPTVDAPTAKITVRDNGPGMSLDTLELAATAGWTGNDPVGNLGLFGMGFNIATARLGRVTKVWTTRENDPEWSGLEIDFDKFTKQRDFRTPILTRPKADRLEHGTEIEIEGLKPEQRLWLVKLANQTNVKKQLGRVYSSMLRPNGVPTRFDLTVNGVQVKRRDHCIWSGPGNPERVVQTAKYGPVNAFRAIDVRLANRLFCSACWQWLPAGDPLCPACGKGTNLIERERRVFGWLGIQRHQSETEYGIDFLRYGRKIELNNVDLFVWSDGETTEPEYPIDDQRHRGRIVGEIHIDHCRVSYTKDRFDRNDPAWQEMVQLIRGDGPLRPDVATQRGFPENQSPLFILFQVFRRSSPKRALAGAYQQLLVVKNNDQATEMATKFYAGEPDYQTDQKWWDLVLAADEELLRSRAVPAAPTPIGPTPPGWPTSEEPDGSQPAPSPQPVPAASTPVPPRVPIPTLSREYREDATSLRWDTHAFKVGSSDSELLGDGRPWRLKRLTSGIHEFYVDEDHSVFRSATMTPLDGLLSELAWSAMDSLRGNETHSFAGLLANLREKYASPHKLDAADLAIDASATFKSIAAGVARRVLMEDSIALYNELSPSEQESVQRAMAAANVRNPQRLLAEGRFLEYAPARIMIQIFENHPELFFDNKYWDEPYTNLDFGSPAVTAEARRAVVSRYANLLSDAAWLADQAAAVPGDADRARLLRASLSLELLNQNLSQAEDAA